ncbi:MULTISPECIES: AAA family ATPase [Pseudomonas]|uniref:Cobalamin biosynthesis cobS-like protein n=1 Tax=Pseudomonas putida TaxID=303 RepID=A0A6B7Q3D5_PSEPU|nr:MULTISPECIES: MoxR family ATPase [Pseudomonas]MBA1203548.1 AAA domain-containing protein [Pseudomonas capeferrum]QFX76854.1 Cobalamin biosynthesis cobS-like protein [Pseudomonas putida]
MTAFHSINDPQLNAVIDTLNPIEVRLAPQVFGTTAPFFDGMQTKIFAKTPFTPKVVPYSFDEELLTRLILWAASAGLPQDFFKASIKKATYIYGPTGAGKTTLVEAFASRTGRSVFTVQCSEETTISDLFGSWKLCGPEGMKWIYGKVCKWAKTPNSILLLDEFDQLPPQIQMGLNGILDGKPIVLDQTGEVIQISPGCLIAATGNTNGNGSAGGKGGSASGYRGTKRMNIATMDRFNVMYCTYMEESREAKLIVEQTGTPEVIANAMATLASKIRANFIALTEDAGAGGMAFNFTITTRNVLNWAMNYRLLMQMGKTTEESQKMALRVTVLDFAQHDEAASILAAWSTVVGTV